MTPEELREFYPPFIAEKIIELKEHPEINDRPRTKIEDFYPLYGMIWRISNKDYQERFWVGQELPMRGDNYMETMETFLGDGEAVLEANEAGRVSMTPRQREMLQKFYDMMEDFEENGEAEDPGYGINDAAIIEDPKFAKCREYAKLVYEELSGDDLDAWEKQREIKS